MESLWSMSTTVRESKRIYGFLKVVRHIEGEIWTRELQRKFQILLVQYREYLNDPSNGQTFQKLDEDQIYWLSDLTLNMPYEVAESIIDSKDYVGGADMRGRQSMAPLTKMGLVYLDDENRIVISDLGNKFIDDEITLEEFFLDSLIKIQYPNPLDRSYRNWNSKPFVATMHLIKAVNEKCRELGIKEKGISKDEFGIFALSLLDYRDVNKYAELIIEYRLEYESLTEESDKRDFRESYIRRFLHNFRNPIKNTVEYTDNMIRYFRQTKLIILRGKYSNTYIDLEPRRKTEIDSILAHDDGKPLSFQTSKEWIDYFSTYGSYELPYETTEKLSDILDSINRENIEISNVNNVDYRPYVYDGADKQQFKYIIQEARAERTYLQNIQLKREYFDIDKIDETINTLNIIHTRDRDRVLTNRPSLELEKWMNIALNIFNDAVLIKPNTIVGDDNEPIHTAPGGVADIECYYETFNAICEVTTLRSRDQWINEGQPVMRHLRSFEEGSNKEDNYCLFVAPNLHQDTVNTFWMSVKYEYEGRSQKIIPITIPQLILMLEGIKKLHVEHTHLDNTKLKELFDRCSEVDGINSSIEWLPKIDESIRNWISEI